MKWIRWGMMVFVGVVVVATLAWAFAPKPVVVETAKVSRGTMSVTIEAEAKTRVKDRFTVSAPLPGRVDRLKLKAGDSVKAGDLLLTLSALTPLLDARSRQQAEAALNAAQAALEGAKARVTSAQAALDYATWDVKRTRDLIKSKSIPEDVWRLSESKFLVATEDLHSAEFAAKVAEFQLSQARAATLTGGAGGDSAAIKSPVNGRVLRVFMESEGTVAAGSPLLEIGDPGAIEIVADILSTDAVRIEEGADVRVTHWGGEGTLKARVRRIEPSGFTKISALGVEEQRVNVLIDFAQERESYATLADAFRVEVSVTIWRKDNVARLPASALFRRGDGWAVYIVEEGKALRRDVQIGRRNALEAELLSGMDENLPVIVHPSEAVTEGVAVKTP
ncbi:MAG: HlyD family efflux transporter periplasmic adaptor subunit [Planctomycetes bacterium]|nr:HlyD family efflux transporter periplasmic adaptor subunit [Planctomycetota bacterium]